MKKKLILLLIIIFLIGIYRILPKEKTNYLKDSDDLYEIAKDYLIEQDKKENNPDHQKEGYHFFITYKKLGIVKEKNQKLVYMWVLGESYYLEEDKPKSLSGYSIFHKFTFENNKVVKVEMPKDGSEYTKSVKEMTPDKKMARIVLNHNSKLSVKDQVEKYYKK